MTPAETRIAIALFLALAFSACTIAHHQTGHPFGHWFGWFEAGA